MIAARQACAIGVTGSMIWEEIATYAGSLGRAESDGLRGSPAIISGL